MHIQMNNNNTYFKGTTTTTMLYTVHFKTVSYTKDMYNTRKSNGIPKYALRYSYSAAYNTYSNE